jgi:ComF family protein
MSVALRNTLHQLSRVTRATGQRAARGLDTAWPSDVAVALDALGWEPDEPDDYCPLCGVSAGPGSVTANGCSFCRGKRQPWDRVTRLSAYAEPMDGWVKAMKFGGQWPWSRWMGGQLAARVGEPIDPARVLVTPVPMHWARRWRRGFNQAHLIALSLAKYRGWRCAQLLRRTRHTHPQTAVVHSDRQANVRDSVAAHPVDLDGWQVILVDDVKTTGATAGLCCRLLRKHGARSIQLAVGAVADPLSVKAKAR